jgi:GNAT superfamily N-acetyltransferase
MRSFALAPDLRMRHDSHVDGFTWKPLTPENWSDFEELFGPRGACAGCWCMWWRIPRSQYDRQKGEGNRRAMKALVDSGRIPGIIGYHWEQSIGWCAVEPREMLPGLARSRTLKPLDAQPVWSVVCLFIRRAYRRQGVSTELLKAAAEYARSQGGRLVEGYPHEPKSAKAPDAFLWTGLASAFRKAGFEEAAKPSPTRRVVRLELR